MNFDRITYAQLNIMYLIQINVYSLLFVSSRCTVLRGKKIDRNNKHNAELQRPGTKVTGKLKTKGSIFPSNAQN